MRLQPGGEPIDISKGPDHVVALIDKRIAELKGEEQKELFDTAEERKAKAEERRRAVELAMLKWSGVPERYHSASLSGWVVQNDKEAIVKPKMTAWAGGIEMTGHDSMVWLGPAGTGKTHLACGMLCDRFKTGLDGLYTTAKGYTDQVKNSYRADSKESSTEVLERFGSNPILVIDEIGRQFEAKSEEIYFFELVNFRYNKRRPTLFLSNLDDEEFRAFVGPAVMDRLREGGGRFLTFNWASRRV